MAWQFPLNPSGNGCLAPKPNVSRDRTRQLAFTGVLRSSNPVVLECKAPIASRPVLLSHHALTVVIPHPICFMPYEL